MTTNYIKRSILFCMLLLTARSVCMAQSPAQSKQRRVWLEAGVGGGLTRFIEQNRQTDPAAFSPYLEAALGVRVAQRWAVRAGLNHLPITTSAIRTWDSSTPQPITIRSTNMVYYTNAFLTGAYQLLPPEHALNTELLAGVFAARYWRDVTRTDFIDPPMPSTTSSALLTYRRYHGGVILGISSSLWVFGHSRVGIRLLGHIGLLDTSLDFKTPPQIPGRQFNPSLFPIEINTYTRAVTLSTFFQF